MLKQFFIISIALFTIVTHSISYGVTDKPTDILRVVYPNVNNEGAGSYGYAVLSLALKHSGVPYELALDDVKASNNRIREMILKDRISVADFGTSPTFEHEFLPIYFPIDMGISGWRLLAIHKKNKPIFEKITDEEMLREYRAGQGVGWADVDILDKNEFKVSTAPSLYNLFLMLQAKRFDFLPLGANEVHKFVEKYTDVSPDVTIDTSQVMVYPFARLFFVKKNNTELHDVIKKGLETSFKNGSFLRLFREHPATRNIFEITALCSRNVIHLENPVFLESMKKIPQEYFLTMDMVQGADTEWPY